MEHARLVGEHDWRIVRDGLYLLMNTTKTHPCQKHQCHRYQQCSNCEIPTFHLILIPAPNLESHSMRDCIFYVSNESSPVLLVPWKLSYMHGRFRWLGRGRWRQGKHHVVICDRLSDVMQSGNPLKLIKSGDARIFQLSREIFASVTLRRSKRNHRHALRMSSRFNEPRANQSTSRSTNIDPTESTNRGTTRSTVRKEHRQEQKGLQ